MSGSGSRSLTEEAELAALIEEQRKDDDDTQWPERHVSFSLDLPQLDGDKSPADSIGIEDGEIVFYRRPKKGILLGASWHGLPSGYTFRGCRCDKCTKTHCDATEAYRKRKAAEGHGTISHYTNHGCKCYYCKTAWRTYQRLQWRKKHKQPVKKIYCACGKRFWQKRCDQRWCSAKCRQKMWKRERRKREQGSD